MKKNTLKPVDHNAIMANQIIIILLNILAYIFNLRWLITANAAIMLLGALFGVPGFLLVINYILRPLKIVKTYLILDHPEPHRFAQGFGGTVLMIGSICLFLEASLAGWILVWLVIGLAAINAFGGFCLGCFVYYWLSRLHLPGFSKEPPENTFPGLRLRGL
jgi:hypothetical protein